MSEEFTGLYHKYKLLLLLRENAVFEDTGCPAKRREFYLMVDRIEDQIREHQAYCLERFGIVPGK